MILATGGIGGLYAVTTNPPSCSARAWAWRRSAPERSIADPEFVQFHPTAIDIGRDPAPLATEALRGEGARLIDGQGERFMTRYHPDAELAPRDVVARAIHAERAAGRGAFLDAREASGAHFPDEFPAVFAACMGGGIDPRVQPIPVAPACHYHMGGIVTDAHGRRQPAGLFAAGECASTGVHGANRLASNSLAGSDRILCSHRRGHWQPVADAADSADGRKWTDRLVAAIGEPGEGGQPVTGAYDVGRWCDPQWRGIGTCARRIGCDRARSAFCRVARHGARRDARCSCRLAPY